MSEADAPTRSLPKASRRASTLINLAFNYLAVVLVIVQGIVMVPLYVSRIPVALYGAWLATGNILSWIDLVDPGISDILRQRVAISYGRDDPAALSRNIGTGLTLTATFALIPLTLWPVAGHLAGFVHLSHGGDTLAWSFRLGLLGTSCMLLTYGVAAINLGLQLTLAAGAVFTGSTLIGIAVTIAALLSGLGLPSLPLGLLARSVVLLAGNIVTCVVWCARHLNERPHFSRDEMRQILGLSLFTLTSRLGLTLLDRADALLSARLLSPSATVTLVLSGRALEPVRGVSVSTASSLMAGLSHMAGAGEIARAGEIALLVLRVTGWAAAIGVGAFVALNAEFVRLWVGGGLFGGVALTVALGASMALTVFGTCLSRLIYAMGGIRQSSGVSLVEAMIKLPLQVLLMRSLGLIGMPIAGIIAVLLVSGWYLPRVAARLFQQSPSVQFRAWLGNLASLALMISLGLLGRQLVAHFHLGRTWPSFVATAAVVGASLALLAFAGDPKLREAVRAVRRSRSGG